MTHTRELNDAFRRGCFLICENGEEPQVRAHPDAAGRVVLTAGIASLPLADIATIARTVMTFEHFPAGDDPYGEHDFGAFDHRGQRIFWKVDCYAPDLEHGSENAADPTVTRRVLTVMLAEEY
jgi:hypothetical protein